VIIPTYNERANLPVLIEGLMQHAEVRALVVDDQSPDGTGEIADTLARQYPGRVSVLHRTGKRGFGRSYIDGMKHAVTEPVDVLCQMDADLSHDPKYLPDLVAALDRCDLAIGSRYLHGISVVNWPLHRIALSAFANRYIRFITGLSAHDCTSGFRVWRRDALARIPLDHAEASGYAFLTEMLYAAARHGCRIGEVPIVFVERAEGYSKVSSHVLIESLLTPWRLVMRDGRVPSAR
jgi:dolichol-phosphate mannosyltransferase